MTLELVLSGIAGLSIAAAWYWRGQAKRARRMQFKTLVRLDEARKTTRCLVRDLMDADKKINRSNERADELNELAAAYVLVSQLDELREEPRAPYPVLNEEMASGLWALVSIPYTLTFLYFLFLEERK